MVTRSAKNLSDGFVRHAIISGNSAQGFVVFNDTAHHVGPFFRWDAMLRLTWTRILLSGEGRRKTARQLFQGKQSLQELSVRSNEVDQHW